jgi:hypothetical protein
MPCPSHRPWFYHPDNTGKNRSDGAPNYAVFSSLLVTSSLLGPDVLLITLLSNTFSLCSFAYFDSTDFRMTSQEGWNERYTKRTWGRWRMYRAFFVGKPEWKRPLGRHTCVCVCVCVCVRMCGCEVNIKTDIKEISWEYVDWIHLTENID